MSRRTDLLQQLFQSDKFGHDKTVEQGMMMATAELILSDLMDVAINGLEKHGPGTLIINMLNDSTVYMTGEMLEADIRTAEDADDKETKTLLLDLIERINSNDWSETILITLLTDAGTRTFKLEAGRSQESLRAIAEEFTG